MKHGAEIEPRAVADIGNVSRPLVLLFLSRDCKTSQILAAQLQELATVYRSQLEFNMVHFSANPDLAKRYQIYSVPSFVVVHGEAVLFQAAGLLPQRELAAVFEAAARHSTGVPNSSQMAPEAQS